METKLAYGMIRTLGQIFADALAKAGHAKPDTSILMHGIAAYSKLNLKGSNALLADFPALASGVYFQPFGSQFGPSTMDCLL